MEILFWVLVYLCAVNGLTFAAFAWDKYCARTKRWRIPEATLLNLALVGGSPGAKLAQRRLRHKSYKQPFGRQLNTIIGLHICLMIVLPVLILSSDARSAVTRFITAL